MVDMHLAPPDFIVAQRASIGGLRMVRRLALGHAAIVALLADRRHPLEHPARMTGFARYGRMGTVEGEIGLGIVVEVPVDFDLPVDLLGHRHDIHANGHRNYDEDGEPERFERLCRPRTNTDRKR